MSTHDEAVIAADNLRRALSAAGIHHDPAGMSDADIARISAAVEDLAAAADGNQHQIHDAIHIAHAA
ncbi:hypothetical protein ACIQH0_32840 [Streptomyces griseus]|uniref:hypothetical protein n=1 Tax=Streptomyces griseus TaxID=1911 RepID=UPI0037F1F424